MYLYFLTKSIRLIILIRELTVYIKVFEVNSKIILDWMNS